jgi:hypothetical protein
MRTPGFTAAASLRESSYRHWAGAVAGGTTSEATLLAALGAELDWVDCNEPFAYYCMECGGTGPGSVRCCRNDLCVVIDRRWSSAMVSGWRG